MNQFCESEVPFESKYWMTLIEMLLVLNAHGFYNLKKGRKTSLVLCMMILGAWSSLYSNLFFVVLFYFITILTRFNFSSSYWIDVLSFYWINLLILT